MKLGLHAALLRGYLTPAGILRLLLPACAAVLAMLGSWPWKGDAAYLIRRTGPDTFALTAAAFLICAGVVAARTGCEQAGRRKPFGPRELAAAGVRAARQIAEKFLFHLGYALLLALFAFPPLAFAAAASGMTAGGMIAAFCSTVLWSLLICGLGLIGRLLFPAFPLLQAALPMCAGAVLLLLGGSAAHWNPLLTLEGLSGASFFSATSPRPFLTLSLYGGMILIVYCAALILNLFATRGRHAGG